MRYCRMNKSRFENRSPGLTVAKMVFVKTKLKRAYFWFRPNSELSNLFLKIT